MFTRITQLALFLCATTILTTPVRSDEPTSFYWLEEPSSTDFNLHCSWPILKEGKAIANMPSRNKPPKEKAFVEYQFEVQGAGGQYTIWGRTFDPPWSSPARWKLDDQPWQDWKPGPSVDRVVFSKTFPIEWRQWGKIDLKPGKHTFRLEALGKRAHGDYPYFVLDVILLTKGQFTPNGTKTPKDIIDEKVLTVEAMTKGLPSPEKYVGQAQALMKQALSSDLGTLKEFDSLFAQIETAKAVQKALSSEIGKVYSGRVEKAELDDVGNITIATHWSAPLDGQVWIGFSQQSALYSSAVCSIENQSNKQTFVFKCPANLPTGKIRVQCVPIGKRLSAPALSYIHVDAKDAAPKPIARSWGIYRDSQLRVHPWSVNDSNMMYWDGKPFIPFGGMLNSPLTWTTKPGGPTENKNLENVLRAELKALKERGISDVFYNGSFVKGNPALLARVVAISEEAGMQYGLHVSTLPSTADIGFVMGAAKATIPEGKTEANLELNIPTKSFARGRRLLWFALNSDGELVENGVETNLTAATGAEEKTVQQHLTANMKPNQRKRFLRFERAYFSVPVKLKQPAGKNGVTVRLAVERYLDGNDPTGYLGTLQDHLDRYKEVYGSIDFGPGMRLWVDPFQNEMHGSLTAVNSSALYRERLAAWLLKQYGTLDSLRQAWGNVNAPLIGSFQEAAQLYPVSDNSKSSYWVNTETNTLYAFSANRSQALRDYREFGGMIAQEMISKAADALKAIANIPVVIKHNCWFSDWFINAKKAGGQDGMGYEAYCYGDSIPYHNTLAPYAQVLQSARKQWAIVTESSAAAFEGQKSYCGYVDRLQMMYDIDQLMKFGAKGFYHFGFSFAGNPHFDTTDLLRDIRQIEWLKTHADTYYAAAGKLADYRPEVYGWYPAYLREKTILGAAPRDYEMDGHYTAVTTQIRQAADGRWIIPAVTPNADWYGLLAAEPLLRNRQVSDLANAAPGIRYPVYLLGKDQEIDSRFPSTWKRFPLDGYTSQGTGVVPTKPSVITLGDFQKKVLGYEVFQTYDINGRSMPDGRLMVWTCAEIPTAKLALPTGAKVTDINGKPVTVTPGDGQNTITLTKPPYEKETDRKNFPDYILGGKYIYPDRGQPEVAYISGANIQDLLKLNRPVTERWLPNGVNPKQVKHWQEAESFTQTTFTQPLLEGFSRYSTGSAIGINTHFDPPQGQYFHATYDVTTPAMAKPVFWLRRMTQKSKFFTIKLLIDGKDAGTLPEELTDVLHLNPWSAGLSRNNLNVGWCKVECPALTAGKHTLEIRIVRNDRKADGQDIDITLMGAQAAQDVGKGSNSEALSFLQLDAWMLTE